MSDQNLEDLPNIGAYSAACLRAVDITTAQQLKQLGAVQSYYRVYFHATRKPSENLLWALAGALEGRHWKSYSHNEKKALLTQLDAHKLAQQANNELHA